jgi:putative two-component system response regulator
MDTKHADKKGHGGRTRGHLVTATRAISVAAAAGVTFLLIGSVHGGSWLLVGGGLIAGYAGLAAVLVLHGFRVEMDRVRAGIDQISRGEMKTLVLGKKGAPQSPLVEAVNNLARQLRNYRAKAELRERTMFGTLSYISEGRPHETLNHMARIGEMSHELGLLAGLPAEEAERLRVAAPLHDLGMVGLPDGILNKPGRFTARETALMRKHATLGHRILSRSKSPALQAAAVIALQHHERWDGMGYPGELSGEEIHRYARIVGLVDVFDAMFSTRVYRSSLAREKAMGIIKTQRGHHFEPRLVDLLVGNLERFLAILERYRDPSPMAIDPEGGVGDRELEETAELVEV